MYIFLKLLVMTSIVISSAGQAEIRNSTYTCIRDTRMNLGCGIIDRQIEIEVSDGHLIVREPKYSLPGPGRELRFNERVFTLSTDKHQRYENNETTLWQYTFRDIPTSARFEMLDGFGADDIYGRISFTNFYDDGRGMLRHSIFHCRLDP